MSEYRISRRATFDKDYEEYVEATGQSVGGYWVEYTDDDFSIHFAGFTREDVEQLAKAQRFYVDKYDNGNPEQYVLLRWGKGRDCDWCDDPDDACCVFEVNYDGIVAYSVQADVEGVDMWFVGCDWDLTPDGWDPYHNCWEDEQEPLVINGTATNATEFAYDGCHKIYLIETWKDYCEAKDAEYDILPISELRKAWENSCGLRFIYNWSLTKFFVKHEEDWID